LKIGTWKVGFLEGIGLECWILGRVGFEGWILGSE